MGVQSLITLVSWSGGRSVGHGQSLKNISGIFWAVSGTMYVIHKVVVVSAIHINYVTKVYPYLELFKIAKQLTVNESYNEYGPSAILHLFQLIQFWQFPPRCASSIRNLPEIRLNSCSKDFITK